MHCCSLCTSNTNGLFNTAGIAQEPLLWVRQPWKRPAFPLRGQLCEMLTWFSFFFPPVSLCQFRYKKRVYRQTNLDEKQLAKLHTKVSEECWCRLVVSFLRRCLQRSARFSDGGSSSQEMLGLKGPLQPPEPR